jgi:hypothetical protein
MVKINIVDFIERSNKIHGNKYDYSLVDYVNNSTKVKIICPIHGVFLKAPVKHINSKQGCKHCSTVEAHNNQRKDIDIFISESKIIHDNKYDYSLVEYKTNRAKVKIICPEHGVFEQTPSNHLRGRGCMYCGGTSKLDTNLFIYKSKLIHKNNYDYSLVNYINSQTRVKIICPEHGIFEQLPNNHLSKEQGCYKCLGMISDTESFINVCSKIHNNLYDYSLVMYDNITSKVDILCPTHGLFSMRCDSHRNGVGCPKCSNNGISKEEIEINEFILSLGIDTKIKDRTILDGKELDILVPEKNVAIEYNGLYWHSEQYVDKDYHLNKTESCKNKNIKLIHIFEDEWLDKKEIVKSRLRNILGLTKNKIYARNCIIKQVSTKESKVFLNDNHIQGDCKSSVVIGLFYNDELVSLMTFGKRPMIGDNSQELIRFCNKINTTVIGGADRLLKFFIKTYRPKEIISYADRRWSQGDLYEKLKFDFVGNTVPNFFYIINKKRVNRLKFQKHKLVKSGYDKNKTANQIMLENNIYKIYDCGSKRYVLNNI